MQTVHFGGICTVCTVFGGLNWADTRSNEKAAAKFAAASLVASADYAIPGADHRSLWLDCSAACTGIEAGSVPWGDGMNPGDYQSLREAAPSLFQLGLSLQTVISEALSPERYPLTKKSPSTGEREIQLDRSGRPRPAFVGKNPSFWLPTGEPQLASQSKPATEAELMTRLADAERLGKPIGIAVILSTDVVVIDFDRKNYPSQEALDREWMGLLDLYPELTQTRIERTPGGGVHIYVRPADGMTSWRTAAGKLQGASHFRQNRGQGCLMVPASLV